MPDLRDMQLLAALARQGHFARAADECGISQPAFSARIRNLEIELGVPVVKRGNRFMGFTAEGEIVLRWARRLLADSDGLRQEIEAARGALSGRLSVGAVPTALAFVARAPARLRAAHPDLAIQLYSLTSSQIHQGLEDFSLDAGITYLDGKAPAALAAEPLYDERYVLLAPPRLAPRRTGTVSWREAAQLPLSLLTRNMRNRRILDEIFAAHVGRVPQPVLETNDFTAALTQVARGATATIAPVLLADSLPLAGDAVRLPLTEPEVATPIVLLVAEREPLPPVVRALIAALRPAPQ
jgi:DNA-binding transcriptional LysR family regulator